MSRKYKKGQYVIFKYRKAMGYENRYDVALILESDKKTDSFYNTRPVINKDLKYTLSLMDSDIIMKMPKTHAEDLANIFKSYYNMYDIMIATLENKKTKHMTEIMNFMIKNPKKIKSIIKEMNDLF